MVQFTFFFFFHFHSPTFSFRSFSFPPLFFIFPFYKSYPPSHFLSTFYFPLFSFSMFFIFHLPKRITLTLTLSLTLIHDTHTLTTTTIDSVQLLLHVGLPLPPLQIIEQRWTKLITYNIEQNTSNSLPTHSKS